MNRDIETSKSFLQIGRCSTRYNEESQLDELIKCFCGLCDTWFKRKSIEFAVKSNGEEILKDEEARKILKKFVSYRKDASHFKAPIEEIIECFELCLDILNGEKNLEDNRADLEDLCYTEYWEDYLTRALEEGITDDFFQDLIRESALRLENNEEFPIFKEELKKKLNK